MNQSHRNTVATLAAIFVMGVTALVALPDEPAARIDNQSAFEFIAYRTVRITHDPYAPWAVPIKRRPSAQRPIRPTVVTGLQRLYAIGPTRVRAADEAILTARKLIREKLSIPANQAIDSHAFFNVVPTEDTSGSGAGPLRLKTHAILLQMSLGVMKDKAAVAEQILDEVCKRLAERVQRWHGEDLDAVDQKLRSLDKQIVQATRQVEQAVIQEKEIRDKHGITTFDTDELEKQAKDLSASRQQLALDLAGKKARLEAIQRHIARVSAMAENRAERDTISKELAKIVAIREQVVAAQKRLYKTGAVSQGDILELEAKLAEAKVRLAERREKLVEMAGGGILTKLNGELATLGMDAVELEAKLKITDEQLLALARRRVQARIHGATVKADFSMAVKLRTDLTQERYKTLERSREYVCPQLTVVGPREPKTPPFRGNRTERSEPDGEPSGARGGPALP